MDAPVAEPAAQSQQNPAPTTTAPASTPAPTTTTKPVHSLVIDANVIIKNDPSVSTLIAQAEELYTIPSVVSEIRDEATRLRFQTTLMPFLKFRTPRPESIKFVTDFARRTGDLMVLSKPDIHLIALTYDLECERNGGDWRLRKEPGQKSVNGAPPAKEEEGEKKEETTTEEQIEEKTEAAPVTEEKAEEVNQVEEQLEKLDIGSQEQETTPAPEEEEEEEEEENDGEASDDDGEWITPTNIKKVQARESAHVAPEPLQKTLQAALITSDMAMRNVSLRINLNLLDSSFARITVLKTWVLRCHGCWKVCKDTTKQFCPSCGQPTLTRVSCTTDAAGNFTLHLKKNFQFNNRGNVYSIPKPTHGTASGKNQNVKGGGKGGWGKELILAEDQKEYIKRAEEEKRTRYRDLMDDDYLPGILTGQRQGGTGNNRIKVGAGRNVNAKKRR
ncbi:Nin one binding Zn-ribbon like-domain-containing protein [Neurospora tetraspora]|uniref:20S-pre-rRNA D-site endonuclease NOB1 n=1 Tax=Neurospora tetraspora TaxID=94610 RepID=A0AAE0MUA4_9PEZI|nr:Nin one binding Zn-ribbon like-domain-containing protein [Neurospora tetraspora]